MIVYEFKPSHETPVFLRIMIEPETKDIKVELKKEWINVFHLFANKGDLIPDFEKNLKLFWQMFKKDEEKYRRNWTAPLALDIIREHSEDLFNFLAEE